VESEGVVYYRAYAIPLILFRHAALDCDDVIVI
jgi:hypothetical protein